MNVHTKITRRIHNNHLKSTTEPQQHTDYFVPKTFKKKKLDFEIKHAKIHTK
eukprot:m.84573 g.84573  ORF g.84573 m.84573 type:complete len:52 (-) comp25769_c0_seq1:243-398(-)